VDAGVSTSRSRRQVGNACRRMGNDGHSPPHGDREECTGTYGATFRQADGTGAGWLAIDVGPLRR
jgi:hypothetical protein